MLDTALEKVANKEGEETKVQDKTKSSSHVNLQIAKFRRMAKFGSPHSFPLYHTHCGYKRKNHNSSSDCANLQITHIYNDLSNA